MEDVKKLQQRNQLRLNSIAQKIRDYLKRKYGNSIYKTSSRKTIDSLQMRYVRRDDKEE
jgi:hypothetical protein